MVHLDNIFSWLYMLYENWGWQELYKLSQRNGKLTLPRQKQVLYIVIPIYGDKDISCASKFMPGIMDKLGNANWSTYRSIRVVDEEIIYLAMDNAGGNGKNGYLLEYSEYLAENYNIVVNHQVPRSPEKNMLELGA